MAYHMHREIGQQPGLAAAFIEANRGRIAALADRFRSERRELFSLAARGSSDNACLYGKYALESLAGVPCHLAAPSVVTVYRGRLNLSRTCVIGVSQSGQGSDIAAYLSMARETGALTVALTNDEASPVGRTADVTIPLLAGPELSVAATKTYLLELLAFLMLTAAVARDRRLNDAIERVPEMIEQALGTADVAAAAVQRYRYAGECVVLGRGYNFASAQECSLKLMETCYIPTRPFSIADFMHGPIASIHQGFPVILFLPHGRMHAPMLETARLVAARGCELIVVSNRTAPGLKPAVELRTGRTVPEPLSPLQLIVPAQLFAFHLALVKGNDPDRPRFLSKVTRTL